ncbi:60S ribosomal protein L31 [Candidatus Woesearchaeota archaeon]|nr:60S ribosomal protein L31 [Candidatus Woesearchaeota archaeon]
MALERTYNVPLRKEFQKVPRYRRSKRAVDALRKFMMQHMKSEDIKIGKHLNEHIWKHGIKNPPHHVKVNAVKDDEGVVRVELFGFKYEDATKVVEEKSAIDKVRERLGGKPAKSIKKVEEPEKEVRTEKPGEEKQKEEKKEAVEQKQAAKEEKPKKAEAVDKPKPKITAEKEKPKPSVKKAEKPTGKISKVRKPARKQKPTAKMAKKAEKK